MIVLRAYAGASLGYHHAESDHAALAAWVRDATKSGPLYHVRDDSRRERLARLIEGSDDGCRGESSMDRGTCPTGHWSWAPE